MSSIESSPPGKYQPQSQTSETPTPKKRKAEGKQRASATHRQRRDSSPSPSPLRQTSIQQFVTHQRKSRPTKAPSVRRDPGHGVASESARLVTSSTTSSSWSVPTGSTTVKDTTATTSVGPISVKTTVSLTSLASIHPPANISSPSFFKTLWGNGVHLPIFKIAYDDVVQELFDNPEKPVPWGTQYELARGVTAGEWTWEQVADKMKYLEGEKDADVLYKVRTMMKSVDLGKGPRDEIDNIAKELDREQAAIMEDKGRGLGLMGHYLDEDDWYGGQIQQAATVVKGSNNNFTLQLQPLEMRKSTRFARHLGSRRILHIRVNHEFVTGKDRDAVLAFLEQKFVLNGRVFVITPPKDDALYAIEINEDYRRRSSHKFGDQHRMSLGDFLEWHNPIELNDGQPIAKYFARAALGLSTSVPVLEFHEADIEFIDDVFVPDFKGDKPAAEQTLTDGCGKINNSALLAIASRMNYSSRPTAVQARIAGSKGLFVLHETDNSPQPKIWIRDSQKKIKYTHLTRAHRILDLLHVSHSSPASSGVCLSQQSIVNMWHNGVSPDVFRRLMEDSLREIIQPLADWKGKWSMVKLWDAINRSGRVTNSRLSRLAPALSRALGFSGREWAKSEGDGVDGETPISADESSNEQKERVKLGLMDYTSYSGRNDHSGAPLSLHEFALEMVQSGFRPESNKVLLHKILWIIKTIIQNVIEKCHIPLPEGSAVEAFVMPDPTGKLQQGQIYYRSSHPLRDPNTQTLFNVVTGPVLIGRYPIRMPSDIQKVMAVDVPELSRWTDVVVVPQVPVLDVPQWGEASFMSILSGGDMDGDTVFVTWYKDIVKSFQTTTLSVVEPGFDEDNFHREIERVPAFIARINALPPGEDQQRAFLHQCLSSLSRVNVGLYSVFHDVAVWSWGYDSPEAIRLAYMFNKILDGPKSGLRLKDEVFLQDKKDWERNRLGNHPVFILDILAAFGKDLENKHLGEFERKNGLHSDPKDFRPIPMDSDLLGPYEEAKKFCDSFKSSLAVKDGANIFLYGLLKRELRSITNHVDSVFKAFQAAAKKSRTKGSAKENPMRLVPVMFNQPIQPEVILTNNVERVMASYAYSKNQNFGYCVAFRTLCAIKAEASFGGDVPCIRLLDEVKSIPSSCRRLFE